MLTDRERERPGRRIHFEKSTTWSCHIHLFHWPVAPPLLHPRVDYAEMRGPAKPWCCWRHNTQYYVVLAVVVGVPVPSHARSIIPPSPVVVVPLLLSQGGPIWSCEGPETVLRRTFRFRGLNAKSHTLIEITLIQYTQYLLNLSNLSKWRLKKKQIPPMPPCPRCFLLALGTVVEP